MFTHMNHLPALWRNELVAEARRWSSQLYKTGLDLTVTSLHQLLPLIIACFRSDLRLVSSGHVVTAASTMHQSVSSGGVRTSSAAAAASATRRHGVITRIEIEGRKEDMSTTLGKHKSLRYLAMPPWAIGQAYTGVKLTRFLKSIFGCETDNSKVQAYMWYTGLWFEKCRMIVK